MSTMYVCPKCGKALNMKGKSLLCEIGHCYDLAKEGYVNLLTADKKHSKEPGDNTFMVRARYDFLEKGYYSPLASALANIIQSYCAEGHILDAGCGSGYYARKVKSVNSKCDIYGVDISKEAVRIAAKQGNASYAVAGVYALPFSTNSFDAVLNVFSPFAFEEYSRVLAKDGILLSVYPAPEHLIELKRLLYKDATFENAKEVVSPLFERLDTVKIQNVADIVCGQDLKNLLAMTPYYFTTAQERIDEVNRLEKLSVTTAFEIAVLKKI